MRFTIERDQLKNALSRALRGVDMNSTLPILSGILITATETGLQLENTNMDVSIRQRVIAHIEEPGQTVVPTKLLNEIVGHLPEQAIQFSQEGTALNITCGKSFYSVKTLSPRDFPAFPEYTIDSMVELPSALLADMVNRVAVAASTDRNRAILNGILVSVTDNAIQLATTDSVRLAVANASIVSEVKDFEIIAPARSLRNALALASDQKSITVGTNQSQIVFLFGDTVYISRRIEGTYPNYKKLIPSTHSCGVRLRMNDLYDAMQRVKAMTISNTEIQFQIIADQSLLVITSNLPDQGNAREEIPVEVDGDDLTIAFNSRFIYDCLQKTDDDVMITFEAESPYRPGIFRTKGDFDYLYLVMPVRPNY